MRLFWFICRHLPKDARQETANSNTFNIYRSKLKRKAVLLIKECCVTPIYIPECKWKKSIDCLALYLSVKLLSRITTYCNFFSSFEVNDHFLQVNSKACIVVHPFSKPLSIINFGIKPFTSRGEIINKFAVQKLGQVLIFV